MSVLNYTIEPSSVFVALTTTLTLKIENPKDGKPVVFSNGQDGSEIEVTFPAGGQPGDLVDSVNFTAKSLTAGFQAAQSAGSAAFQIGPSGFADQTLQPGESIRIQFESVTINGAAGEATVAIVEYLGLTPSPASVLIKKLPQQLGIIAWLSERTVGLSRRSTLFWQSFGGTRVVISGFAGQDVTKPVHGEPPYPGNISVNVPSRTEAQRTYTLTVFTNDQKHEKTEVTLTQVPAEITSFEASPSGPVAVDAEVELDWHTLFGVRAMLLPPSNSQRNVPLIPSAPLKVIPGADVSTNWQQRKDSLPASAIYKLIVQGFPYVGSTPAQIDATVEVPLEKVSVNYFKYTRMDDQGNLSLVDWRTTPSSWLPVEVTSPDDGLNVLSLYQPGGTSEVLYLGDGSKAPQIQYFSAKQGTQGKWTLIWVTANLTALTLDGKVVEAADVKKGSLEVTVTGPIDYTLVGTDAKGEQIQSLLRVGE